MFELHHLSAVEQLDWLRRGDIRPIDLVEHYLDRIARLDGGLGAFTTVTAEAARARAVQLDTFSHAAALWGLPIGDKDLVDRAGVPTGYGSRLLAGVVAETSHELVLALDRAGAISLGKTNAPEFGLPSYTESVAAGPARNPWNTALGAGGSSGGAAVAVSAGLLPVAPGSDGGGSIRIPAAATGLVGLKPSRGRIPTGSGLDRPGGLVVPGPLARSVGDAALLLDALVEGPWEHATRAPSWGGGAYLNAAIRGEGRFQLGVMTESPWDDAYDIAVDAEASTALRLAVDELSAIGHGIDEVAFGPSPEYAPAFRVIWQASAAGIPAEGDQLELLEPLTRWLLERGRSITALEFGEALTVLAGFERRVIRTFAPFDAVLTPALAQTPRPLGWYDAEDGERNFAQQVQYTPFTSFVNVAGLPAITLPVLQTEEGLPMGVQLIGRPGREDVLLAIGAQLERRLHWNRRHPPGW